MFYVSQTQPDPALMRSGWIDVTQLVPAHASAMKVAGDGHHEAMLLYLGVDHVTRRHGLTEFAQLNRISPGSCKRIDEFSGVSG